MDENKLGRRLKEDSNLFSFFGNIFNVLFGVIFLLVGVFVGLFIQMELMKANNQVMYCKERDGTAQDLNIVKEDGICAETKSKPSLRFFKHGRGYVCKKRWGGKSFTRYFGKEATAYLWKLIGFSGTPKKPVTQEVEFPTLEEAMKHTWGKPFYSKVPEEAKEQLRNQKLLVTVDLEPGIVPEGYQPVTEQTIRKKANEDMASLIAAGVKGLVSTPIIQYVFIAATGFAVCAALFLIGILKVPVVVVPAP